MASKKILLFYVSENSGHHRAALAIQEILRFGDGGVQAKTVNTLRLTNPLLENFVLKTYLGIIKNAPEVWDYLYDNQKIKEKIDLFQKFVHKVNASKLLKYLEQERPSVLVCTQAFPCGMIADGKSRGEINLPLVAVITDYAAHAYWVYEDVDLYVVPADQTRQQLIAHGIGPEKVLVLGIPISPRFNHSENSIQIKERFGLSTELPLVLIMGGGHGLGPIEEIVDQLDSLEIPLEIVVVTGTNKGLKTSLEKKRRTWTKQIRVHGYLSDVAPLMSAAEVLISKPGGLTISEAMASTLPMILINPLPGQEARNA